MHHACSGVFAEQRTLGAAQHFHALHVEHLHEGLAGAAEHHAVDHGGNARFHGTAERLRADAANGKRGLARVGTLLQVERGHQKREVLGGGDLSDAQILGAERGHRHRNVLQALLAFGRGHDNLFQRQRALLRGYFFHAGRERQQR